MLQSAFLWEAQYIKIGIAHLDMSEWDFHVNCTRDFLKALLGIDQLEVEVIAL